MSKGKLLVLSGPSGVGKGTMVAELIKQRDDMCFSVSATTRAPRPGDQDGVNYFFVSKAKFEEMIAQNQMLEYARYVDNYYGTPRAYVEEQLESGKNVILEIEVQGARQVVEAYPDAISVYIIPPTYEELEQRLRGRGTETEVVILERLNRAIEEARAADFYKYIIVNNDLTEAVKELNAIITAEKSGSEYNQNIVENKKIMKEVFKL